MSSILDALKKVEQESTPDQGAGTPWPAPLSPPSSQRRGTRHWWVAFGMVVSLCVLGVVFWQTRQPATTMPVDAVKRARPVNQTHDSALPFAAKRPQPLEPVAPKTQDSPTATMLDDSPRQAAQNAPASGNQASTPMTAPLPVNPVNEPSPAATKELAPPLQPPLLAPENTQPQTAVVKPEPETTLPSAPNRPPAETGQAAGQSEAEPPEAEKTFRRDPRIKLQALVWAPDAAARFVVINNRLIREGGSVDNIVVVRIDQDDVLLAEGSDRWHEKFNIR